jgi:hypothetical protein
VEWVTISGIFFVAVGEFIFRGLKPCDRRRLGAGWQYLLSVNDPSEDDSLGATPFTV